MSDSKPVDLWAGSEAIFTDYEGTIVDATFQAGQYGTQMVLTFGEVDGREDGVVEFYGVPDSWESSDGGETINRVDGKNTALPKSSKWQRFVMAAGACDGAREALGETAPVTASVWIGTKWRMEAEPGKPYSLTDKDTGEKKMGVSKAINFPVEFLGKDVVVTNSTSSNGNGKVDALSVLTSLPDPVLQSNIADLAKTASHGEWFGASYKMIGEAGLDPNAYPDLVAALGGKTLYEQLGGKG